MKKILIFLLGLILGFYFFMPKEEFFYLIQKKLYQTNNIAVTADIKSDVFKLSLLKGKIYYNDIQTATFDKAYISPYIFYNKINIFDIKLPINNLNITKITLTHNILNPYIIKLTANGNFAKKIHGNINFSKKEVRLYFEGVKNNTVKKFLKKDKKGYFYYEKF